jgi:hypothetical protein
MEVSDQLHSLVALFHAEISPSSPAIEQEDDLTPKSVWTLWGKEQFLLSLLRIETLFLGLQSHSLVNISAAMYELRITNTLYFLLTLGFACLKIVN